MLDYILLQTTMINDPVYGSAGSMNLTSPMKPPLPLHQRQMQQPETPKRHVVPKNWNLQEHPFKLASPPNRPRNDGNNPHPHRRLF